MCNVLKCRYLTIIENLNLLNHFTTNKIKYILYCKITKYNFDNFKILKIIIIQLRRYLFHNIHFFLLIIPPIIFHLNELKTLIKVLYILVTYYQHLPKYLTHHTNLFIK